MVPQSQWNSFAKIIEESGFFIKPIIWKRCITNIDRYGEDQKPDDYAPDITIHTLSNYNYMRSWPITVPTESGEIDRQSIQLLFLRKEFVDLGLLLPGGYVKVDPARDRFIIDGLVHKAVGDTFVSQAGTYDVIFSIVVKREETTTGEFR